MRYEGIFRPTHVQSFRTDFDEALRQPADRRDGDVYVYDPDERIVLAVNVALATGRPLLVFGAAGSGKSTLAANVARTLQWRYYETVVTSRTQAQDLLWHFDAIRRLADAHGTRDGGAGEHACDGRSDLHRYIEPGVLWWAFDPDSAQRRGDTGGRRAVPPALNPSDRTGQGSVVLVDEIDKADPDVPNNLLVPIGSTTFTVYETSTVVKAEVPPLIIITTNGERDLPPAFLRRCVTIRLPDPDGERLVTVARSHFGPTHDGVYRTLADKTLGLATEYRRLGLRAPSVAEFLDAVRACLTLGIAPQTESWDALINATLAKAEHEAVI